MDLDQTKDEMTAHIAALYAGLPPAFAAELNEIEFRLGHSDGKQFVPDVGVIDFDAILKAYIGKYAPPTQLITCTAGTLELLANACRRRIGP